MRAYVRLKPDMGPTTALGHGDLIGRLRGAALFLDDARISEGHAMVSLRGSSLELLALRGRLAVEGRQVGKVSLIPGLRVLLAPDLGLTVEEVVLPASAMAIEGDDLPRQLLTGVSSLLTSPRPRLASRYDGDAAAWLWSDGQAWNLRLAGEEPRRIEHESTWSVGGRSFRAVAVPLDQASGGATRLDGGLLAPLRIQANYDTVNIHREGQPVLVIGGVAARLISELVAIDGPAHWLVVAELLWRDSDDERQMRKSWDVMMLRLRRKLKGVGVRSDLVQGDGRGQVSLVLRSGDVVEDRT